MHNSWSTYHSGSGQPTHSNQHQQMYNNQNPSVTAYGIQQQPQQNDWDFSSQQSQHTSMYNNVNTSSWNQTGGAFNNTSSRQQQQQQQQHSYGNFGLHSQLNVNAPVFTPRSNTSGYQHSHSQNQYDNYGPSYASAPMYGMSGYVEPSYYSNHVQSCAPAMQQYYGDSVPPQDDYSYDQMYSVGGQGQQYVPSHELQDKIITSGQNALLTEIQVGLEQLISDSDEFESWAGAIKDRISDSSMSTESRTTAVQIVTEMAIACSPTLMMSGNPQYSFARLLALLNKEVPFILRDSILPTLQKFHGERTQMADERKQNLLIFFAEVYDKIELPNGSHINKLASVLVDQLDEFIKGTVDNQLMKTTIQVIKLTGRYLDSIPEIRVRVDDLLTTLSGYANGHPKLSESIKTQITAVIELREKGWGCNDKCGTSSGSGIIGADGQPLALSEEERIFLESHFGALESNEGAPTASEEAEMMRDFEEYMKEEQKAKKCEASEIMEKLKIAEEEEPKSTADEESTKE